MTTSTTAPVSGAPSATSRASLPLSTQQQRAHGQAPTMGIRLPQASFPRWTMVDYEIADEGLMAGRRLLARHPQATMYPELAPLGLVQTG